MLLYQFCPCDSAGRAIHMRLGGGDGGWRARSMRSRGPARSCPWGLALALTCKEEGAGNLWWRSLLCSGQRRPGHGVAGATRPWVGDGGRSGRGMCSRVGLDQACRRSAATPPSSSEEAKQRDCDGRNLFRLILRRYGRERKDAGGKLSPRLGSV